MQVFHCLIYTYLKQTICKSTKKSKATKSATEEFVQEV